MRATTYHINLEEMAEELNRLREIESRLKMAMRENANFPADDDFHRGLQSRMGALLNTILTGEVTNAE